MGQTFVVHGLTDDLQAICARRGISVNEAVNLALEEFMATHPIIQQTRTPQ